MPFVETSVSRDIFQTIDLARELRKNAAIVGRPGVGKTRALRAYVQQATVEAPSLWHHGTERINHAHLMTATAISGNTLSELLCEISEMLGLHTSGSIANVQRQIHKYNLSHKVLIIDESQNLNLRSFRELLNLYDFTGLCVIFCGNEEVLKRVNTDKGAFAQISRRVPFRAEVNSILDEDTDRIASAFGVEGMDAHRLMRAIGRAFHADGVVTILEIAHRFASGKTIRAEHVRRACEPFPQYRTALKP